MKRNLLVLLLAFAMVATMLASCGGNGGQECEHPQSESWDSNATHHWHPAACEHGEFRGPTMDHVDENEDEICDVCGYDGIGHEHTFATEWVVEEYYHWHKATCTHSEEKGTYELHSDNNHDCVCDYCEGHVHAMNIIGYCSDTGCEKQLKEEEEIENFDIASIVYGTGATGYAKINGGVVNYDFVGRSNTNSSYASHTIQKVDYKLGKDFTYTKRHTDSTNGSENVTDTIEGWYEVDGNGVFGVTSTNGGIDFDIVAAASNHLYGYYYAISTLADGHGAENILYRLFELSQDPNAIDFVYELDEGIVTFSYNYLTVNANSAGTSVHYFVVSVSFTYADMYALTGLDIKVDCYTSDPGVSDTDGFLEDDVDIDYNETTGEFSLRENAKADTYTVKVTQTVGQRSEKNEHPKSSFVPDSFDIFSDPDCTTPIKDEATMDLGTFFKIYLGNYAPAGTSVDYVNDYMRFEILDENGNVLVSNKDCTKDELMNVQSCSTVSGYYSFDPVNKSRFFVAYPKTEGVYTYVIYFLGEKTHEIDIYAGVEKEEEIVLKENQFAVKITQQYAVALDQVSFTATTAGTYTFSFSDNLSFVNADEYDAAYDADGNKIGDDPTVYYDFQNPFTEKTFSFEITLEANETIRFYVTSDAKGTYVVDYVVK